MRKIVFVMVVPVLLMAGTVSHSFSFAATDLTIDRVAGYDVVSLRGAGHTTEIGTPLLPRKAIYLLVPSDAAVTGVKVTVLDSQALSGSYRIYPMQKPVTTNESGVPPVPPIPSYLAGPSDSRYPGSAVAGHSQKLSGSKFLTIVDFRDSSEPRKSKFVRACCLVNSCVSVELLTNKGEPI